MPHFPSQEEFARLAGEYSLVPVYRQLMSDRLTPVSALERLGSGGPGSFLLESVVGGERVGRYSFLGWNPCRWFEAKGNRITERDEAGERTYDGDPLLALRDLMENQKAPHLPNLPRFVGGAVGYAAYDAVRYVEKLPNAPHDDRQLPDLCFGLHQQMVIFDHIRKTIFVVVVARVAQGPAAEVYSQACQQLDEIVAKLSADPGPQPILDINPQGEVTLPFTSNLSRAEFMAAVDTCREYIKAGDFFQIVPSQRLMVETDVPPLEVYRTLRVVNPSPFMVYMNTGACTLVASSPEIMVRVENGHITTRPLAGTRPRGETEEADRQLAQELLADPKERAEHIMLVDLGRNDVGRVSEFNTVRIDDVMTIEKYSHVMHITSNVTGMLRPGLTPLDALWACLPAGTVSGAPKVRAMEVIDQLEPTRRGPYAGAIGYIDFTGNMDTCIALRTIVMTPGKAYVQAGAGIVYDSDPASEWQETMNKAKGMLRAIEITQQRLASTTAENNP